jgi:hypothetical protein
MKIEREIIVDVVRIEFQLKLRDAIRMLWASIRKSPIQLNSMKSVTVTVLEDSP